MQQRLGIVFNYMTNTVQTFIPPDFQTRPVSCSLTQTDLLLVEDLHGIMLSRFSVPHQHHTAKRARAQSFQPLKLLQASSVLNRQNKKAQLTYVKVGW